MSKSLVVTYLFCSIFPSNMWFEFNPLALLLLFFPAIRLFLCTRSVRSPATGLIRYDRPAVRGFWFRSLTSRAELSKDCGGWRVRWLSSSTPLVIASGISLCSTVSSRVWQCLSLGLLSVRGADSRRFISLPCGAKAVSVSSMNYSFDALSAVSLSKDALRNSSLLRKRISPGLLVFPLLALFMSRNEAPEAPALARIV